MKGLLTLLALLLLLPLPVQQIDTENVITAHCKIDISSEVFLSPVGRDRIILAPGVHKEHICVNRSVEIIGNNSIIDGSFNSTVLEINSNNVVIRNLTITNAGGKKNDALVKINSDNVILDNCTIFNARNGVIINGRNVKIKNCLFYRLGIGVRINSSGSIVSGSFFRNCGISIYVSNSEANRIYNCSFLFNGISVLLEKSRFNILENLTIRCSNENQGGILLDRSIDNKILNTSLISNGFALRLYRSHRNLIENVYFKLNKQALDLILSNFNKIEKCNFTKNNLAVLIDKAFFNSLHYSNFIGQKSNNILGRKSGILDARFNFWKEKKVKSLVILSYITFFPWLKHPVHLPRFKDNLTSPEIPNLIINFTFSNDTDGDGCKDDWEVRWGYDPQRRDDHYDLDPDGDGLSNVEECIAEKWGANPFRKDIFIEMDWMKDDYKLKERYKKKLLEVFDNHNITLHIDDGCMGGGEKVEMKKILSYPDLIDIYWDHFLNNNPNNQRKGIFRYVLLCHDMPGKIAGGFCFVGWNTIDSYTVAVGYNRRQLPRFWADFVTATVIMHELGHTMGLFYRKFEGIDNYSCQNLLPGTWKFRNYKSCMNYFYTWFLLDYSNGKNGRKDFDDWSNLDLSYFKDEDFC